ncbi:PhnD/SsuA/transferrin family substrate-binding protein [Myxococcus sp. CA051A]|uniref:PhnD/SsuA/transferrin family substrate-binding protein n=1 Tax=unclassified Myxococcus TaxID=2648731 RepID=UPI00157AD25B|nr:MULTISPECIES: PhnD/SsuA/transferrin family substrate-binding protein [unclassified Myxococcus]NTX16413.1 PhnD/SsuA/transferrin family substrate-binding protein [Myxococcus sp. CA056]NTX62841.1 PhnD/SsuA/transferrin family substrate-binding protein [Myxococcus sp. CA051A]
MKTLRFVLASLALALCFVTPAGAAPKKATLGVFLATTLSDGQERFQYAEALAAKLTEAMDRPVAAKSFGRYEDFSRAIADGLVDFAVVEGWAAVQLGARATPLAWASRPGESQQRWAIVSTHKGVVKDLAGKRLALVKGAGPADPKFVTHAVLGGDLDAQRHFKLAPVPNVESALKMLEAKGAEAALVPMSHVPKDKDLRILFRSARLPGAVLVDLRNHKAALDAALGSVGAVAPFEPFARVQGKDFEDFRRLVTQGPPRRQPVFADAPDLRVDAEVLVRAEELGPSLPSFAGDLAVAAEQPDD